MAATPIVLVAKARRTSGEFDDDVQARAAFGSSPRRCHSARSRGPALAAPVRKVATVSPRRSQDRAQAACRRFPISVVNVATDRPDYVPVPHHFRRHDPEAIEIRFICPRYSAGDGREGT